MKKIFVLLMMVVLLSACEKKVVNISDSSKAKIEQGNMESAIREFWMYVDDKEYTQSKTIGFDEIKYALLTTYSAVGVTTPSNVFYDTYKIEKVGEEFKVTVRIIYKNAYVQEDDIVDLCTSQIDNGAPRYSDSVYKNLDMPNAIKIRGKIHYKTWDNVNGGQYHESAEKEMDLETSFKTFGEKISTGLGKDQDNNSYISIYRNNDAEYSFNQNSLIAEAFIKKGELYYYTPVGSNFEKIYTMKIIKQAIETENEQYVYKVDMNSSFN